MGKARWIAGAFLGLALAVAARPAPGQMASEDAHKRTVIAIELSWLADPELCCYYPLARIERGKVVVGGYLPSTALRDKAIAIAKMVAQLPTEDDVKVHPGCRFVPTQIDTETLLPSAAQTLKLRFAGQYSGWQLGIRGAGEIVVAGLVDSVESKLLVSQKLRGLPGCKCVVNHLQVQNEAVAAPDSAAPLLVMPETTNESHAGNPPAVKPGANSPAQATAVVLGPGVLPPNGDHAAAAIVGQKTTVSHSAPLTPGDEPKIAGSNSPPSVAQAPPTVWQSSKLPALASPDLVALGSPQPIPDARPAKSAATAAGPDGAKVAPLLAKIQKVGGDGMSNLQVKLSGNRLAVQFFAPSQKVAERLAEAIMALPELAPYWLELKIDVPG